MFLARSAADLRATKRKADIEENAGEDESVSSIAETNESKPPIQSVEDDYDYVTIHGVTLPERDFDLTFFGEDKPVDGKTTKTVVVVKPHSRPDTMPLLVACTKAVNCCCYYCSGCSTDRPNMGHSSIPLDNEYDVLLSRRTRRSTASNKSAAKSGNDSETTPLITGDEDLDGDEHDGIYQDVTPILIPILLSGELVAPNIASLTGRNIALSRATQRILRDIKTESRQEEEIRIGQGGGNTLNNSESILSVHSNLLRFLDLQENEPILRVISNPLDYSYRQIVLPDTNKLYGGQLGQWSTESTPVQRLGPLPGSYQHQGGGLGSILKVFLFQMVVSDHPYMNAEERHFSSIKDTFNQYCSIFEQKAIEHLAFQTQRLVFELNEFLILSSSKTLSDEEYGQMQRCYEDIVEMVPALSEISQNIHGLTLTLYKEWKDIKEIRRRQSYISTPAVMKVRKLRSNLTSPRGKANRNMRRKQNSNNANSSTSPANETLDIDEEDREHDVAEDIDEVDREVWDEFCEELDKLPGRMKMAKKLLWQHKQSQLQEEAKEKEAQDGNASAQSTVPFTSEPEGDDRIIKLVEEACYDIVRSTGILPFYAMQLSEGETITPESLLPSYEIKRRRFILNLKFKLVVKVNGQVVTTSPYLPIHYPSYLLDIRSLLEIRLMRQPKELSIDIYCKPMTFLDTMDIFVSSVLLPIPGSRVSQNTAYFNNSRFVGGGSGAKAGAGSHFTHNIVPVYGGFSFTSDLFTTASIQGLDSSAEGSGTNWLSQFLSWLAGQNEVNQGRRMSGNLYGAIDFDSLAPEERTIGANSVANSDGIKVTQNKLAQYPAVENDPTTHNSLFLSSKKKSAGGANVISDFTRDNDFQQLLPALETLDLNDPQNDHLLYLKSKRSFGSEGQDIFRLQGLDYALIFQAKRIYNSPAFGNMNGQHYSMANFMAVKDNLRIQLLRLRVQKPYLFQSDQGIPLLEHFITNSEIFKSVLQKETLMEEGGEWNDEDEEGNGIIDSSGAKESANLVKVTNFLARVRNSMTAVSRKNHKRKLTTSSVVLEIDYFPEISIPTVLFERKRDLKPRPNVNSLTSKISAANSFSNLTNSMLLVQVVGARNVPMRGITDGTASNTTAAGAGAGAGTFPSSPSRLQSSGNIPSGLLAGANSQLGGNPNTATAPGFQLDERKINERKRIRSFVEVKFQEKLLATIVYEGSIPLWKQSLTIPFTPPQGDFTPLSLEQVREEIYFTLFDEVREDDAERGGFLEGENTYRVEKYYLGSFSVPFNTVYREGRIEGVFRLDTPLINFGYERKIFSLPKSNLPAGITSSQMLARDIGSAAGLQASTNNIPTEGNAAQLDAAAIVQNNRPVTTTMTACCELTSLYCMECCPNMESFFTWCTDCIKAPFMPVIRQSGEEGGQLDSLYNRKNPVSIQTQAELSYYVSDDHTTYMKVLLTFDPVLPVATKIPEDFSPSSVFRDDRMIALYAQSWIETLRKVIPETHDRPYKVFGVNSSGLSVFVCRFLTSQPPPQGFNSRRACLHLVSNIPFMKDAQSFIGELDLWCTNQQFWEIGAGDEEEHAVMLYNYLRYLMNTDQPTAANQANSRNNRKDATPHYPTEDMIRRESVFLVLGKGIPEGDTVYILVRDQNVGNSVLDAYNSNQARLNRDTDGTVTGRMRHTASTIGSALANDLGEVKGGLLGEFLVINPCTGHVYSTHDPYCPLKSIYCMFTPYNCWANIQPSTSPTQMSFDVLNTNYWRPFFGKKFPPPTAGLLTIQDSVEYIPTEKSYCEDIEKAIHQAIRNGIRRWRSKRQRSTTTFHPEACNVMLEMLPKLEEWKKHGDGGVSNTRVMNLGNNERNTSTLPSVLSGLDDIEAEIKQKLQSTLRTRHLRGFPINIPFTDVEEVINKVRYYYTLLFSTTVVLTDESISILR